MIFEIGPFSLYRVENKNRSLDIFITGTEGFGWEWGYEDPLRGATKPLISFRVGKLVVFYFEKFKKGFEIWVLGFWWIK